jgi:hypothetical protein
MLAPKVPRMAARTASVRCVGEISGADTACPVAWKVREMAFASGSPVMGSMGGLGKSQVGRATSRTPEKAIKAARASRGVKGSRSQRKQTRAVRVGMRKVRTVASEMGR